MDQVTDISAGVSSSSGEKFKKWASGFSGCDGGDIGTKGNPSIWVSGLEWGGGHDQEALKADIEADMEISPSGYESASANRAYIFNRQTLKLLTAIDGKPVSEYIDWNEEKAPFTQGSKGYFKMNLFPIAFKDTGHQRWLDDFSEVTGFSNKQQYLDWCRSVRFQNIQSWVTKFCPKLILCFGKTYINDFAAALKDGTPNFTKMPILNRELSWTRTSDGVLIAVCPFPVNRYGLNSDVLLQAFGERIRQLMVGAHQ